MQFSTQYSYRDRETKARYVWQKYQSILTGSILDVGADEQHLKQYLGNGAKYWGIGLGGHPDQQVDLEKEDIPFPDDSFDCVLCLDVLEHLENIHVVFDELCRVTRRYVIILLPNAWSSFYKMLLFGDYQLEQPMKFYGLPIECPEDRHKWFFSADEAEKFIVHRAKKNHMQVLQLDYTGFLNDGRGVRGRLNKIARSFLFRGDISFNSLFASALWVVLEK
ncbi:MAG: class I SAM-dependent methyltransferase [Saprospiraceae bacterium]|nr:MAG: class I SAM-dependent methyltransferase [Saprospiraceae bacterium]